MKTLLLTINFFLLLLISLVAADEIIYRYRPYASDELSDGTTILNFTWGQMKYELMRDDYQQSVFFVSHISFLLKLV